MERLVLGKLVARHQASLRPHERERTGTSPPLAAPLAPRRPDGGPKRRARALVIVENRDPPAWVGLRPGIRHDSHPWQARCQARRTENQPFRRRPRDDVPSNAARPSLLLLSGAERTLGEGDGGPLRGPPWN